MPLVGRDPLHDPPALHEVALVEPHVNVAEPPAFTVVGDADKDTTGAGTVPGPPPPQAGASRTDPAINSPEIERKDIPSETCSLENYARDRHARLNDWIAF